MSHNLKIIFPLLLSFKAPFSASHPLILTLRLFLPSVSGIWDALTCGNNIAREALLVIRRGMSLFRQGDVLGSLVSSTRQFSWTLVKRHAGYTFWKTLLSIHFDILVMKHCDCYRIFGKGAYHFTTLIGVGKRNYNVLHLNVGRDPWPVMREAYNMFIDGGDPEKLVAAFSGSREGEYFYASLYAGLYYESENETDAAKVHIVAACQSPYGQRSDDYMASLAKVHCPCRNWVFN
ncbi:hypothetical protein D0Y65_055013 [Glycine soja]|uniref:Uncharacterized protein n=1 Tax=Glycine soja TaxID=3848 RepID=A0A445F9K7_GLYSO|nr:hypothetical protein D0Y65_055013 [Glycine soja]